MPKVHTHKARKDYPTQGIQKGDTYYKWSLRPSGTGRGTVYRSLTPPMPWQLTGSAYLQSLYQIQHAQGEVQAETGEELAAAIQDLVDQVETLSGETQESLENMPEGLQQGATGELLQERIDALETAVGELEEIRDRCEEEDADIEDMVEEVHNADIGGG